MVNLGDGTRLSVGPGSRGPAGAPGGSDAAMAAWVTDTASQTRAALSATYAPLDVFHSGNYPDLLSLFAAADVAGDCTIKIAPGDYTTTPLRLDSSGVTIDGYGATVTLAAGSNASLLTIGPDALNITIQGVRLDANGDNQTGTSHGVYFESYAGALRPADRSDLVRVDILNALTDGLHIGAKRVQIQALHTSIRDFGRRGVHFGGTDCTFDQGAVGIGPTCVYMDGHANWVRNSGLYSSMLAAVRITENGRYGHVKGNSIDNNEAKGIHVEGTASATTFDAIISENHFRANSQAGEGTHPDIYLKNARAVLLSANDSVVQTDRLKTSYAVFIDTGVQNLYDAGNLWEPLAHTLGKYNAPTSVATDPSPAPVTIGAPAFANTGGTPTLSHVNNYPVWLLDAATTERLSAYARVPNGWTTVHIDLYWINAGAGAGDAAWLMRVGQSAGEGDTLSAIGGTSVTVLDAAGAQNVVQKVRVMTAVTVTPGEALVLYLIRNASDAGDTLPNDAGVAWVEITRA